MEEAVAEELCRATGGDFRDVTVGLYHLEKMAKAERVSAITGKMLDALLKMRKKRNDRDANRRS